jgi:hypothetical protein
VRRDLASRETPVFAEQEQDQAPNPETTLAIGISSFGVNARTPSTAENGEAVGPVARVITSGRDCSTSTSAFEYGAIGALVT